MRKFSEGITTQKFGEGEGLAEVQGFVFDTESGILLLEKQGSSKAINRFSKYLARVANGKIDKERPDDEDEDKDDEEDEDGDHEDGYCEDEDQEDDEAYEDEDKDENPAKATYSFEPLLSKNALKQLVKFRSKKLKFKANLRHEPDLLELFFANSKDFQKALKADNLEPELAFTISLDKPDSAVTKYAKKLFQMAKTPADTFDTFMVEGVGGNDEKDTIRLTTFPMRKSLGKADLEQIATAGGDIDRIKNIALYAWNKYEGDLKKSAKSQG
jgi:hypothetical protein